MIRLVAPSAMDIKRAIRSQIARAATTVGLSPKLLTGLATWGSATLAAVAAILAVAVHPIFWIVAAGGSIAAVVALVMRRVVVRSSAGKPNTRPTRITDAQVFAVMDSRAGRITASHLSDMTRSTSDAAAAKLRSMAVDGQLTIDSESSETELVYVRSDRSLPGPRA